MREYKPSNKVGLLGIPLMLIAVLLAGGFIGGLAFFITYQFHFFLIIIFPLIMGILGALTVGQAVKFGKVRNPKLAGIFGLLAGLLIIGGWLGAGYEIGFRNQLVENARLRLGFDLNQEQVDEAANALLEQETGETGFVGYLLYSAQRGTTLSYRGFINLPLNGFFTWILWLIEWGIIVVFCAVGGLALAEAPFNERTGRWYGKLESFSSVSWEKQRFLLELLKQGDYQNAGALMTKNQLLPPCIEIEAAGDLLDGESDWLLKITSVEPTNKNTKRRKLLMGLLSPQEFTVLRDSIPVPSK